MFVPAVGQAGQGPDDRPDAREAVGRAAADVDVDGRRARSVDASGRVVEEAFRATASGRPSGRALRAAVTDRRPLGSTTRSPVVARPPRRCTRPAHDGVASPASPIDVSETPRSASGSGRPGARTSSSTASPGTAGPTPTIEDDAPKEWLEFYHQDEPDVHAVLGHRRGMGLPPEDRRSAGFDKQRRGRPPVGHPRRRGDRLPRDRA